MAESIRTMVDFNDAVKDCTSGQCKVFRRDYEPHGLIPVIDQGQTFIAGYTNNDKEIFTGQLPVVLFGDHTLTFKYVDFPFALGADGVKVLSINKAFNPKYVFYYWKSCQFQSRGYSRHFKYIRKIELPLIPLSEQQRIVEILDQADALRQKRVEAVTKTARILPALFFKMFGNPATNSKGWPVKPLSDFGAQIRYGLGQPPKESETGVALIRATNISRGIIRALNMIYVDPQDVPPGRNAFLKSEEVIVVRSGAYTGDIAQVTDEWEGCVAGYDLVITPGQRLMGEYVESYLLTSYIQKAYFQNLKARAGQPHLNSAQVAATPFLDVPYTLQIRFSQAVQSIRKIRRQLDSSDEYLQRIYTVLLHRAFTGDLTVKWRAGHMKELLQEMEAQTKQLNVPLP